DADSTPSRRALGRGEPHQTAGRQALVERLQLLQRLFDDLDLLVDLLDRAAEIVASARLQIDRKALAVHQEILDLPALAQPHIGVDDALDGRFHFSRLSVPARASAPGP